MLQFVYPLITSRKYIWNKKKTAVNDLVADKSAFSKQMFFSYQTQYKQFSRMKLRVLR